MLIFFHISRFLCVPWAAWPATISLQSQAHPMKGPALEMRGEARRQAEEGPPGGHCPGSNALPKADSRFISRL